jgi:hypothetical protein
MIQRLFLTFGILAAFTVAPAADGKEWEKVGTSGTKRIVHRLVPHGKGVLLVGGAVPALKENATAIEWVPVESAR